MNPTVEEMREAYEKLQKMKERAKIYSQREDRMEKARQRQQEYYEEHREEVLAKRAALYKTDEVKEKLRARAREYYQKNRESLLAKARAKKEEAGKT